MTLAAVTEDAEIGPRAEKAPDAFRTIKEVSEDLDVPQHVLRFWETRFAQIRPVKRAGGRRYYRPTDVDLLRGVRQLLHGQGYTIRGAQRVLRENGVRFVQAVGRGEAAADAPSPQETEPAGEASTAEPPREAGADRARAALEEALAELKACRDALAALRLPPEQ
ncbi:MULTISPECIES: MerR family transcriptional regulator [Methylobacterium]|uniref:MerR family transcriptional regulator n=1 Tax=Methylobacterium TaxID=407 RepID=UPI0010432B83|nr:MULTISPECIES: MerR family transcriptional regulator [Methylobacterium]MDR7038145.1 DNA-binding transcriptional MerR regulator [Methylobacterium sp. BE186]